MALTAPWAAPAHGLPSGCPTPAEPGSVAASGPERRAQSVWTSRAVYRQLFQCSSVPNILFILICLPAYLYPFLLSILYFYKFMEHLEHWNKSHENIEPQRVQAVPKMFRSCGLEQSCRTQLNACGRSSGRLWSVKGGSCEKHSPKFELCPVKPLQNVSGCCKMAV